MIRILKEKLKLDFCFMLWTKINNRWIKDLNVILCNIPETNIIAYVNYNWNFKNKISIKFKNNNKNKSISSFSFRFFISPGGVFFCNLCSFVVFFSSAPTCAPLKSTLAELLCAHTSHNCTFQVSSPDPPPSWTAVPLKSPFSWKTITWLISCLGFLPY